MRGPAHVRPANTWRKKGVTISTGDLWEEMEAIAHAYVESVAGRGRFEIVLQSLPPPPPETYTEADWTEMTRAQQ